MAKLSIIIPTLDEACDIRSRQLNAGAALARGEVPLFLHADTQLTDEADTLILRGLMASGRNWGRFDVAITGNHAL